MLRQNTFKTMLSLKLCTIFLIFAWSANACVTVSRIVGETCAEACLNKTLGVCPLSIIEKFGGLQNRSCSSLGYTKLNGTIRQEAGPCGYIVFTEYLKASVSMSGDITLATFDGAQGTTFQWEAVNDPVMGGQSFSTITTGSSPGGLAHWYGDVKIVPFLKSPGFCTIRTEGTDTNFPDVSGTSTMKLYARNNATSQLEQFMLSVQTKGGRTVLKQGTYDGPVTIPATGQWVQVKANWEIFKLTWRGEPIAGPKLAEQLNQITQIGLSTYFPGKNGTFDLELQYISAGN